MSEFKIMQKTMNRMMPMNFLRQVFFIEKAMGEKIFKMGKVFQIYMIFSEVNPIGLRLIKEVMMLEDFWLGKSDMRDAK